MSRASNTLKASDSTTTPIKLKYAVTASTSTYASYRILVGSGSNGSVTITGSVKQDVINFRTIRQLYYQNYLTGSLKHSASYWNSNEQSTACQGSAEYENRYFPTESTATIKYIAIPSITFGEQISRSSLSFIASNLASTPLCFDDGNGNIVDNAQNHYGNVIYSQGLIIITKQDCVDPSDNPVATKDVDITPVSFLAETTIYQNEYRCRISENDFNCTQNPSANKIGTTGSYIDNITGSDFKPYATCIGLYNDRDELLVVGKLSTPYPISPNTDMTFVVRYDS